MAFLEKPAMRAADIRKLSKPGRHRVATNLYLRIRDNGKKTWLGRTSKNKFLTLGEFGEVGIDAAKDKLRTIEADIAERDADKMQATGVVAPPPKEGADLFALTPEEVQGDPAMMSLRVASLLYIQRNHESWKVPPDRVRSQEETSWRTAIGVHFKNAGVSDKPALQIDDDDVAKVLKPIWRTATGKKVREKLDKAIKLAAFLSKTKGHYNPAAAENATMNLGRPNRKKSEGHPAPTTKQMANMCAHMNLSSPSGKAFLLTALAGNRVGETLQANLDQFDFDEGIWAIENTKKDFVKYVPITPLIREIVESIEPEVNGDLFPSRRGSRAPYLSSGAVLKQAKKIYPVTTHGTRATFATWAQEQRGFSEMARKACLGHIVRSETDRAYLRSKLLAERTEMMLAYQDEIMPTVPAIPTDL